MLVRHPSWSSAVLLSAGASWRAKISRKESSSSANVQSASYSSLDALHAFWWEWDSPTCLISMSHKFSSDLDINVPSDVPTILPRLQSLLKLVVAGSMDFHFRLADLLGCAAACRESFRVFSYRTCFMTQPASRYTYCQSKARYSCCIFRKTSPYKLLRRPVV